MSGGRPPHVIGPDEVAAWLADSAVRAVTYHATDRASAARILASGIDIAHSRIGAYGQGFYTSTEADPFFGDTVLAVAVRLRTPLRGDTFAIESAIDGIADRAGAPRGRLTVSVARQIRRELLRLGYDGIVVEDGGGDGIHYVIALEDRSVRIVCP